MPAKANTPPMRERGFADAAQTQDRTIHRLSVGRKFHLPDEDWQFALREWLAKRPKPVGIFCINDESALNVANACRGIGAADVIRATGMNRRSLERRFRQHLQTSMLREIQMSRLDEVRRRLSGTRVPITQIAEECGFVSQTELSHIFKRDLGSAPSAYRKEHFSPGHPERLTGEV